MEQLERFIEKGEIVIAPSAFVPGFNRLLILQQGQSWNPITKQIALGFKVCYIDEQENILNVPSLQPYFKPLIADATTRINPQTYTVVPHPGARPTPATDGQTVFNQQVLNDYDTALALWENTPTEYQVFRDAANGNVNTYRLMLNTTLLRVSQGKLD
jgi:hypothetical protein